VSSPQIELGTSVACDVNIGCAESPDLIREVRAVAAQHDIDPRELLGAVNTTGLSPVDYLCAAGEAPCPRQPAPPPVAAAPAGLGVWSAIASCETGGHWNANTGNGYYGGLQQDMTFWRNHGGLKFASHPNLATPAQQVQVAVNGRDGLVGKAQGWCAWPTCAMRLHLVRRCP
jgi:Transglycosylase-like domain